MSAAVDISPVWMYAVLDADLIVRGATVKYRIGQHAYDAAGVEQVWGAEIESVLRTRQPIIGARHFWNGCVWEGTFEPHGDGGVYIQVREVEAIVPADMTTLNHFAAAVTRVSAALAAGGARSAVRLVDGESHPLPVPTERHAEPALRRLHALPQL